MLDPVCWTRAVCSPSEPSSLIRNTDALPAVKFATIKYLPVLSTAR